MARRAPPGLALARAGALLLLAGCLPDERPFWVIDHPDALTMRFEVVARGPWGSDPPASGGPVAEVMPGDRVRVVPFVAGVAGPVDVAALRPRFFACPGQGGCSLDLVADAPPACGPIALPVEAPCLIGQGWPLEFEIGELVDLVPVLNYGVSVLMVAGAPEGPSTDECLRRLARLDEETAPLQDCLFFDRTLRVGPAWRALLLAWLSGVDSPVEPYQLPSEVAQIEPDVAPAIAGFYAWVPVGGGGERYVEVEPGGTLSVRPGDALTLGAIAAAPPQQYMSVSVDAEGAVATTLTLEARASIWYTTAGAPFYLDPGATEATWTAPDEPGEVVVYAVLADVRSAGASWLRIEVAK